MIFGSRKYVYFSFEIEGTELYTVSTTK